MKLIKLIMPSQGDMEIVEQGPGHILLKPTFFGGECAGPIIQFVERSDPNSDTTDTSCDRTEASYDKVEASYRIRIRKDDELRIAKAE